MQARQELVRKLERQGHLRPVDDRYLDEQAAQQYDHNYDERAAQHNQMMQMGYLNRMMEIDHHNRMMQMENQDRNRTAIVSVFKMATWLGIVYIASVVVMFIIKMFLVLMLVAVVAKCMADMSSQRPSERTIKASASSVQQTNPYLP